MENIEEKSTNRLFIVIEIFVILLYEYINCVMKLLCIKVLKTFYIIFYTMSLKLKSSLFINLQFESNFLIPRSTYVVYSKMNALVQN